jgi:uncharacterized protein YegP (UPF0339 family)
MLAIKTAKDGSHYFVLRGRNGRVLMTSETYKVKRNAKKSADRIANMMARTTIKSIRIVDETKPLIKK